MGIALVDFLRAFPLMGLWEGIDWWEAVQWVPEIRASNEAFGAHLSLYGVLYFHSPLTYGSSLNSLLASVVPRIFWPTDRRHLFALCGRGWNCRRRGRTGASVFTTRPAGI